MPCITLKQADDRLATLKASGAINYLNKVNSANEIIENALKNATNPRIAFSGGKDSLVVLDLVRQIRPDVQAVYCNTGIEYPETVHYVRSIENVMELHPITSYKYFLDCKENGLPGSKATGKVHGNKCCLELKEKPATKFYKDNNIDLVFTGLTSDESRNRMMFFKRMGPYYLYKKDKYWKAHPIHDWSEADVWEYIKRNKLDYNPIYDIPGIKRCGCRFCTAYLTWKDVTAAYDPHDTEKLIQYTGQSSLNAYT